MSGLCGALKLDGSPIDPAILNAMTQFMRFRGPDDLGQWLEGPAGLGHTLLKTTRQCRPLPMGLEQVWITADARIDDQQTLREKLRKAGREVRVEASDAELILQSYLVWGERCVDHLLGDFCFALWDARTRNLLCARDHFGIKPFFYAQAGQTLAFSNTLDSVRQHPEVSGQLNDLFMADFLLFGASEEPDATAFEQIHRLPAGHLLTWNLRQGLRIQRYWSLPEEWGMEKMPPCDHVAAFTEVLESAVSDRLRTHQIGVELSGGMDSTSIAAVSRKLLQAQHGAAASLHAICYGHREWFPDKEPYYAHMVAKHLDIPIHVFMAEDHRLFAEVKGKPHAKPEPRMDLQPTLTAENKQLAASLSRVWLSGWDGDALLSESLRPHLSSLLNQGRFLAAGSSLVRTAMTSSHLFKPGFVRSIQQLGQVFHREKKVLDTEEFPGWLNSDLVNRLRLRDRWAEKASFKPSNHPRRPYACTVLNAMAQSGQMFDDHDAGMSGVPLVFRHPLMDLRLIHFCLALPIDPWVIKKHILREAMAGLLPRKIVRRPKTPLAGSPLASLLKRDVSVLETPPDRHPELAKYVNACNIGSNSKLSQYLSTAQTTGSSFPELAVESLDRWLKTR